MKNHGIDSIRFVECFFFFFTYSNLPPVVIYGYYATYLIARARNNSTTSGLYDKNEHRSIAIGRCYIPFVWEWSFLLVARYALLVMYKPTIVDARRSL